ncbi:hypothetical protein E2C01_058257 [Portunus trituberculatus]|uniref:Uncharacterized protein n=1 Tax=Portunus trituberculatus TaxID=210409 RepID=A0A5B7H390_PORTR|nr:hypothetical protein [Portunus trituberculatus]
MQRHVIDKEATTDTVLPCCLDDYSNTKFNLLTAHDTRFFTYEPFRHVPISSTLTYEQSIGQVLSETSCSASRIVKRCLS